MKKFITFIIIITIILLTPVSVHAASSLNVSFSSIPLFNLTGFIPGSFSTAKFSVNNMSSQYLPVLTKAVNVWDDSEHILAPALNIKILNGANTFYWDNLLGFYGKNYVNLGTLAPGETRDYQVTILMDNSVGPEFQGRSTGFDLEVGTDEDLRFNQSFPPFQRLYRLFPFPTLTPFPPFPRFHFFER